MSGARRFVALLRGVNVGGARKLPMKELAALFAECGAAEVRTYIQSGNVVFEAGATDAAAGPAARAAAKAAERVAAHLAERFGGPVPVVLRSAAELDAVVAAMPFDVSTDQSKRFSVGFLDAAPAEAALAAFDPSDAAPDRCLPRGRELYLHYPGGSARSRLTHARLEKELGRACTVRNWNTVLRLQAMCRA